MYEKLYSYLISKIELSDSDFALIKAGTTVKKLRKGQYLLQEGDVCRFTALVISGCLKTYRIDEKGIEHIVYFAIENFWAGDRESYTFESPARFSIDAIEESEVMLFSKENFERLCKAVPAFGEMINQILQKSFINSQNRIHAAISYSAEEKYLDFLNNHKALANRIPQQMIASFLGITPETLSRIRNTISKKSR